MKNSVPNAKKSPPSDQVVALRAMLRDQFPEAHRAKPLEERDQLVTGIAELDEIGVGKGQITEIVSSRPSSGSALILASLLQQAAAEKQHIALIDGRNSFDPQSLGSEVCRQMLWVRCRETTQAMKAADLLLRDGNLPTVILDLQLNQLAEIRGQPSSSWHRFRGLVEKTRATFLVFAARKTVTSAHLRVTLERRFGAGDLEMLRGKLRRRVRMKVERARTETVGMPRFGGSLESLRLSA